MRDQLGGGNSTARGEEFDPFLELLAEHGRPLAERERESSVGVGHADRVKTDALLGVKLALAGHDVKLVCLPNEADQINAKGAIVRLRVGKAWTCIVRVWSIACTARKFGATKKGVAILPALHEDRGGPCGLP